MSGTTERLIPVVDGNLQYENPKEGPTICVRRDGTGRIDFPNVNDLGPSDWDRLERNMRRAIEEMRESPPLTGGSSAGDFGN